MELPANSAITMFWIRKVGEEEESLGTNINLNEPYESTGRYKATYNYENKDNVQKVEIALHIKGIEQTLFQTFSRFISNISQCL